MFGLGPAYIFFVVESMIEAGILDGDTLVVRKQEDASNGDVLAAPVDD